jgi:tetratricopeptide (TPR) repeat protein
MNKEALLPYLLDNRELNKKQEKALDSLFRQITTSSVDDRDAEDWFILGAYEVRRENYDEALDAFTFAIEKNKNFEAAWKFRATAYGYLEDWEKARADIDQAIKIDDSYADAYLERAAMLRREKKWDEALKDIEKAITLDDERTDSRLMRAQTLYDSGEYKKSVEAYTGIIEEEPDSTEALSGRGLAYFFSGDAELALQDIRKARTLEGGSTVSEFNMGLVMSALPEHSKQAYRHFEKAFKKDRKMLVRYVEMADEQEYGRLLDRLDEILKDLEARKEENFYTRELYNLLQSRVNDAREASKNKAE